MTAKRRNLRRLLRRIDDATVESTGETRTTTWDPGSVAEVYEPEGELFSYSPCVIVEGNEEHIYTCHNDEHGIIEDHIYHTHRVDGEVVSSEPVLEPGPDGAWDQQHTCDPSVVAGDFRFAGEAYDYAMFYLGSSPPGAMNNRVGVAFANSLAADRWVKYPDPIIEHPTGIPEEWGSGQPSAVSVDEESRVLLFYSQSTSETGSRIARRELDLSDMADFEIGPEVVLPVEGTTDRHGNEPGRLMQADLLYDRSGDRFFMVRELAPHPDEYPEFIGAAVQVTSIHALDVWEGAGTWRVEGDIDQELTGFPRNHNAGFTRNEFGHLPSDPYFADEQAPGTPLRVVFTRSCSASTDENCQEFPENLWTYDLWKVDGRAPPPVALAEDDED